MLTPMHACAAPVQGISVIVLEGRNRTGGRMYTVPASGGLFLDFGCSWIHGINGSSDGMLSSNPIWDIAVAGGIVTGTTGSPEDLIARGPQVWNPCLKAKILMFNNL